MRSTVSKKSVLSSIAFNTCVFPPLMRSSTKPSKLSISQIKRHTTNRRRWCITSAMGTSSELPQLERPLDRCACGWERPWLSWRWEEICACPPPQTTPSPVLMWRAQSWGRPLQCHAPIFSATHCRTNPPPTHPPHCCGLLQLWWAEVDATSSCVLLSLSDWTKPAHLSIEIANLLLTNDDCVPWMNCNVTSGKPGTKTTLREGGGTTPSRCTSGRTPDGAGKHGTPRSSFRPSNKMEK